MGTYLGRPCPSPPPQAVGGQHPPGRLGCPQPDPRTRRFSVAGPGHPAVRAPLSTRRPAQRYAVTLYVRFILQTLRSFLGVLTSLCRRCHQRKAVLDARISTMCRGSASGVGTVTMCGGRQLQVTPVPPTTLRCAPGSCTKTVRRALGESGKGMAQQEEEPAFPGQKDHQKTGPDGSRGARSAFRPLRAQGDLSAFVPRPGPLRRNLPAKKLPTSCISSCPPRNAITSSYSSTRGYPPGQRRTGPPIPRGLPQSSSRKGREQGPPPPCAAPLASQGNSRPDGDAEATRGQRGTWENGAPTSDSSRPRRRRFPLLPRRRGEPLRLPPAPELGFRVTAEDLDAEKAAAFRRINSALQEETPAEQPADPLGPGRTPPPERGQESASPEPMDTEESAGVASSGNLALAPGTAWLPGFQQKPVWGPLRNRAGGGGPSQPPAGGPAEKDARPAFPAAPSSTGMGSSRHMDSPVFAPQRPSLVSDPQFLPPTSQLIPSALQTRPSPCTSGGLAPHPTSDTEVTPMDTTPPSQSPLFGSPPDSNRSLFSSPQTLQTPPRDSVASVRVSTSLPGVGFSGSSHTGGTAQPISGAPDVQQRGAPAWDHSRHYRTLAAPALAGDATSAPGTPAPPTNSPMGTHANTQLTLAATPAAFPSGPAPTPGSAAATFVPRAVPSAGPNGGPGCSTVGGSRPAPCRQGVSAAPRARVAQNTRGLPGQSPPVVTRGPRANNKASIKNKPGLGGATALNVNHMPGSAPRKRPYSSIRGGSPPPANVASRGVSTPASTPSSSSSKGVTARKRRAARDPSPSQDVAGHKTAGPSTKSSSSRARSAPSESKRKRT